jgi:hypothetical protein
MKSKILFSCILALGFASSAHAAKFKSLRSLSNPALEEIANSAEKFFKDEETFGDCSSVQAYSFVRKATEKNLNTMKQLNIAKAGVWADDDEETALANPRAESKELIKILFENVNYEEEQTVKLAPAMQELSELLDKASNSRRNKNLEIYESGHANEDGSWRVLDLLDTKNNEVLLIRVGFCGT